MIHRDITRCLAHTPEGKPNGCPESGRCAYHLAIRTDDPFATYSVTGRRCAPGALNDFRPVAGLPDDAQ